MASNENDGDLNIRLREIRLQVQAAQARQAHIEHQTRRGTGRLRLQEFLSGSKCADPQPYRSNQAVQRFPYAGIIV
jgi:hypothetical protein